MKKFLLIRISALGDIIHALPTAYALKKIYPDCIIDWVVSDKFSNLLINNPLVDNVWLMPLSRWRKNWLSLKNIKEIINFNKTLQKQNYDIALDLHGMFKSAIILGFCGAKRRIGYKDAREFATMGANELIEPLSKRPHLNYHIIKRHFDMLKYLGIKNPQLGVSLPPTSENDKNIVDALLKEIDLTKPIVILAPATTWVNKHWKIEHWSDVLDYLENKAQVVFTGSDKDLELIEKIISLSLNKNSLILAGKTTILQLAEVFSRAKIVITPDSGSSHLAWATNGPSVITIFCATSSQTFGPLGEKHFNLPKTPLCAPCHKRKCPKGTNACVSQIKPQEVIEIIKIF